MKLLVGILGILVSHVSAQTAGSFAEVGTSGVSALLAVQVNEKVVYLVDKTENNSLRVDGHAAWGAEYDLETNNVRPMAVRSNTFCAGGAVLGNGTILNVGGNLAVTTDNAAVQPDEDQSNVYDTEDGRRGLRLLDACEDGLCEWSDSKNLQMNSPRWYPTPEILEDGSAIIIGGSVDGGYINPIDNPTYEYFPSRGEDVNLTFLSRTYPLNLYPLAWLLPDKRLFMQSDYEAINLDHVQNVEQRLPNIPHAFRVYPASASHWLTPLTSDNNFTHTINFCGGTNLTKESIADSVWGPPAVDALNYEADNSCTRINPLDENPTWEDFDYLPEGRIMGSALILPDLTTLVINGAKMGTAGYGAYNLADWMTAGQSYADQPTYTPVLYDPKRPEGERWTSEGFQASSIGRLYHSTALLLHDGSIFVAGSNPNADVETAHWHTEYRVERFYPSYFSSSHRPEPKGLPDRLSYGGEPWNVTLSAQDLLHNATANIDKVMVTYVRPGHSTHAINFGQRAIKLDFSYTLLENGDAILHVSQLPPNPAIFAPGPALLHVVVDGIPSIGKYVMAGNGKIGDQPVADATVLPRNITVATFT